MIVTACGYIDETSFGSNRSLSTWRNSDSGRPDQLRWRMVCDSVFDRFGRLDLLSRFAVVAVEMLRLRPPPPNVTFPDMGISVGTQFGSFEVDVGFMQGKKGPGGGSPILFPYTLPSTVIGEIAIRHRITGPSVCVQAGTDSALAALWQSVRLVESGEVAACIYVGCDGIFATSHLCLPDKSHTQGNASCFAYAFLIENENNARKHSRTPLAQISIDNNPNSRAEKSSAQDSREGLDRLYKYLAASDASSKVLKLTAPATLRTASALVIRRIESS